MPSRKSELAISEVYIKKLFLKPYAYNETHTDTISQTRLCVGSEAGNWVSTLSKLSEFECFFPFDDEEVCGEAAGCSVNPLNSEGAVSVGFWLKDHAVLLGHFSTSRWLQH
jgi:hypothetical protein